MHSNSRVRFVFAAAAAGLLALSAQSARGQAFYAVNKGQSFVQTSSAGAVPDPNRPFGFSVEAATNATLTLPAGGTQALKFVPGDNSFSFEQSFATKAALDAAFPNGTYRLSGTGLATLSFNLTADTYPIATPQVTGGTWTNGLLVIDPTQPATINISTFGTYATAGVAGHMEIEVRGLSDSFQNKVAIATQPVFGITAATNPIGSLTIPAGRMTSGRVYQGSVQFDTLTTLDTTSVPGGGVVALFGKSLSFYIVAQAPGTTSPLPVIIGQPTNQTGVLGGRATFGLGVTINGVAPTQNSNLTIQWSFNGQQLNIDGTKYSFNGGGLTVNNLTAADVGTYFATLISPGGLLTTNTATLTLALAAAPTISRQPSSQTVTQSSTVVFDVAASGTPAPAYQWQRNGANLSGATNATLVVNSAGPTQAGTYAVVVSNSAGTVTSATATLTLSSNFGDPGRLINLSILTPLSSGETMTMGTVLGGVGTSGNKPLLARAAGPSLGQLGITAFLPDPTMTLVSTSVTPNVTVASNDNWDGTAALSTAFASVGAFAYVNATSKDAALFQPSLAPGNYTVQVSDTTGGSGTVIAELYDSTGLAYTPATPRLINVSVLKQISTGGLLTAGFVIGGSASRTVLIRAVGPTLGLPPFGIGGVMPDPQLKLFNSSQAVIATNDDWGGDFQLSNAASRVGAFTLSSSASKDAVLLVTLAPGNYTAQVSPVAAGGLALVEVYEVP